MDNLPILPDAFQEAMLAPIAPVPFLDRLITAYGASADRAPADYTGKWIDQIAWAVDSAVAAVRLGLAGQLAGAALIARHQLERWTNFRAFNTDTKHIANEDSLDYIARVWSSAIVDHYGIIRKKINKDGDLDGSPADLTTDESIGPAAEPERDHEHVMLSDGEEVCPAMVMMVLSNVLHAAECTDVLTWDAIDRCDPSLIPEDAMVLAHVIADAISLSLRQVRTALLSVALEHKDRRAEYLLLHLPDRFSQADQTLSESEQAAAPGLGIRIGDQPAAALMPTRLVPPPPQALLPLHPQHGLRPEMLSQLDGWAVLFDDVLSSNRPAGRLFRDDELLACAFSWHRRAAARAANRALDEERARLGDEFDIESLNSREYPYIIASEAAGVMSSWLTDAPARAASLIASALRSSYWLWLEDDDRAMGVLRSVLEQTARLKAWRTKPEKARRLEGSASTSPRDWLDAAGWRRLEALNRALGELAHSRVTARWLGARDLLADIQLDVDPEESILTARGHCLDLVVTLVCHELGATATSISPVVGRALDDLFELYGTAGDSSAQRMEAKMTHIWDHRRRPFGGPTFFGPGVEWAQGQGPSGLDTRLRERYADSSD